MSDTAPTVEELRKRVLDLARHAGVNPPAMLDDETLVTMREIARSFVMAQGDAGRCRSCQAAIWWIKHANGKATPYTREALNHFIDCPSREKHRRK